MTFEKLEKNLMDVVLEEQAKLGFRREKIRLYYPLSTLNHLLGTQDTAEQMEVTLAGQPESMEQVIALYYDQIYKFCYWKTHSAVDAQDITQDTFIRFMDAAQTYSDIESPKALLYTIAHHLCLNWLKKVPPDSLDELRWDQEPAAEDFADHAVQKIYLSTAIAALPNEQQEVLLLRYGQDLKVGEIAEILGLSRFQVMYRVRGALRQLKKLLKEESP